MKKVYDVTNQWKNIIVKEKKSYKFAREVKDVNNHVYKYDSKTNVYNYSEDELECAKWILNNFGGDIKINFVVNSLSNIKIADFTYTNSDLKLFDILLELKTPTGKRLDTIKHRITNSYKQSPNFIIDIKYIKNINEKSVIDLMHVLINEKKWIKLIIIKNGNKLIKVFQKK